MDVPVGRSDRGWEISVVNVKMTERGKELFGSEELVRIHITSSDDAETEKPPSGQG